VTQASLVVIPAFNEERSVGSVVEDVRALGYPACVVDDGSEDRTCAVAEAAGATVLKLPVNLGVGGALRCGFRFAVAEGDRVVVQVRCDSEHTEATIHWKGGYESHHEFIRPVKTYASSAECNT